MLFSGLVLVVGDYVNMVSESLNCIECIEKGPNSMAIQEGKMCKMWLCDYVCIPIIQIWTSLALIVWIGL